VGPLPSTRGWWATSEPDERAVEVRAAGAALAGVRLGPPDARGVVVFAHGSGSGRNSPRNRAVAYALVDDGFAALLLDLLTPEEQDRDARTGVLRFDVGLLGERVTGAIDELSGADAAAPVGVFGASTGAAAALTAAAARPDRVRAVVSRGGRPDLAGEALALVRAPTLLIVGGEDHGVLPLNERAARRLGDRAHLSIVPGAGHLFVEPGALDRVSQLARAWFAEHLTPGVNPYN
jgi:putative phosphoribosyl transferase